MIRTVALVIVSLVTGCGPALQPTGTDSISPTYTTGGGEWDSGGGITAVARIFGRDGGTVICGAWMTDQQSVLSINYNEDVMAAASVFAGNSRLVSNLSFMQRLPYSEDLTGQQANCVSSEHPWTDQLSGAPVALRFPRMSFGGDFGVGVGLGIGSGDRVTFRETPRATPFR